MFDHSDCSASAVVAPAELDSLVTERKKKTKKNTRKFSDEQIRSLEVMFESESRIEPRKKTQLARELGLQPRQVAIWFQNKRARWKSKQLERDYSILQTNYNSLASMYEALKKEKQALVAQLQKLNDLMQRPPEERQSYGQDRLGGNNIEGESDSGDATKSCESDIKPSLSMERSEHGLSVRSDGDTSTKAEYFGLEDEPNILNMVDGTMASSDGWGSLNSDDLLDQSNCSSHWWDFWS